MITFITHIRVRSENTAAFETLMSRMCDKVRENEPDAQFCQERKRSGHLCGDRSLSR